MFYILDVIFHIQGIIRVKSFANLPSPQFCPQILTLNPVREINFQNFEQHPLNFREFFCLCRYQEQGRALTAFWLLVLLLTQPAWLWRLHTHPPGGETGQTAKYIIYYFAVFNFCLTNTQKINTVTNKINKKHFI